MNIAGISSILTLLEVIEYVFGCIQETLCLPPSLPPSLQAAIRTHQYCQSTQGHHCCCLEVCDHKADVRFPPKWKKNPIVDHQQWEYHAELVLEKCKQCTLLINDVSSICQIFSTIISPPQKVSILTYEYVHLNISPTELMLARVSLLLLRV